MDRFDVCEAYYCYATDYHGGQWSAEYALFAVFERIGFKPRASLSRDTLSDGAWDIYCALADGTRKIRDRRPEAY